MQIESKERKKGQVFVEDPRYKQCNREALMGVGLGLLNLIWWYAWGYGLGSGPPENYRYILGFPAWFFMSCIAGAVLFTGLTILMVSRYYKEMPLGKITKEEAAHIKKNLE